MQKIHFENFYGDSEYPIDCKGKAVTGDEVKFARPVYGFDGLDVEYIGSGMVEGKIVDMKRIKNKKEYRFYIETPRGTARIRAHNLFRNHCYRKQWSDENRRDYLVAEAYPKPEPKEKKPRYQRVYKGKNEYETETLFD